MRLAPGTILRDKYQVVRKVDDGDEGEVFEARHLDLAGRYAIKFICEGGIRNAILLDELRREALAASALSHPGIVRVYDLDQAPDGSPFMVMEFLNGRDLARVLGDGRALALSDVAVIVEAIAAPLGEAHRRGIVHGDLTPANVFVLDAEADPHARVKLLDFGVARIRAQAGGIVRGAGAVGPSPYQAPEQQQGRTWEVDERADVYSLGAIAQALITGRAPGAAGRATASASAVPVVPPAVTAAIARAMSPHREGRFRTAVDFARALRAGMSASPARASGMRPTRTGATPAVPVATLHAETERVRRRPASMPRLLAAAVGCGVAILGGAIAITKLRSAPPPAARAVTAVARPIAPAPSPKPAAPVSPSPPAASVASTDRARQPLPPREPRVSTGPRRHRSAHAGMSDEARRDMEQAYQKASRAFDLGNYDEAIAGYKRTYELGGDAPMLYNIAQALRLSKRPDEATGYYRRYLERAPKAPNRDEVLAKLAETGGTSATATAGASAKASPVAPAKVAAVAGSASPPSPFDCRWPQRAAPGKWIDVSCSVDAQAAVARAFLIYRQTGASGFALAEMVKSDKGYRGSIPPSAVAGKGLELYFEGRRSSGETVAQNGSPSRPNTIVVDE